MSSDLCCFCLGNDTDIPSFGSVADAQDMLKPCTTCSISCHRKCLLDWFNTIPSDQLHIIQARNAGNITQLARQNGAHLEDIGIGSPPMNWTTNIRINLSSQGLDDLISSLTGGNAGAGANTGNNEEPHYNIDGEREDLAEEDSAFTTTTSTTTAAAANQSIVTRKGYNQVVYILASCPQCKKDIVFVMRRSQLLSFHSSMKTIVSRLVQYGGIFLGFTSAVTGVVSMGYIGLTTAGLKMMDCMIPGPLLVRMLTRKSLLSSKSTYTSLSKMLFGNTASYAVDNLEQALVQGLIDPLKFSRIPVLPIAMYRSRSSSILKVLLGGVGEDPLSAAVTEFMVTGYISSIADHSLARSFYKNIKLDISRLLKGSLNISQINPVKGIDFFTTNNIISMLIPLRWAYDLLYRLTFNRAYFNLTMKSRPRAIANTLGAEEIDYLEDLNSQINDCESVHHNTFQRICKTIDSQPCLKIPIISSIYKYICKRIIYFHSLRKTWWSYFRLRLRSNLRYTYACLKCDYSSTLSHQSSIFKAMTTVFWPYVSSKVGLLLSPILCKQLPMFNALSSERKILVANIVGLVIVAICKEFVDLYLAKKKVSQMQQIEPLNLKNGKSLNELAWTFLGAAASSGLNTGISDNDDVTEEIFNQLSEEDSDSGRTFQQLVETVSRSNNNTNFPGNFPP